jgi:hypothetical protein
MMPALWRSLVEATVDQRGVSRVHKRENRREEMEAGERWGMRGDTRGGWSLTNDDIDVLYE